MPGSLADDVIASIAVAARNNAALEEGLRDLRDAVADRAWEKVDEIRGRMLAAVDGYVDHYVAAGRRVEYEKRGTAI